MIFLKPPSKEILRVTQLDCQGRRTYISERIESLLDKISDRYRVKFIKSSFYKGNYARQCAIFEHEDGTFKVVDWNDSSRLEKAKITPFLEDPKCQFVLKCQYNKRCRVNKVRPFFYFEKTNSRNFSLSLPSLRDSEKTSNKIYWKGNLHVGNLHLGRYDILTKIKDLLNEDWQERATASDFYQELSSHELAVSLPGMGKSCHREFECFAVGTAVIAPVFQNTYHMPLVPNYHYLAIESGPIDEKIRERVEKTTFDEIAEVRKNAMKYYDDFIRFEPSVKMIEHLLEL